MSVVLKKLCYNLWKPKLKEIMKIKFKNKLKILFYCIPLRLLELFFLFNLMKCECVKSTPLTILKLSSIILKNRNTWIRFCLKMLVTDNMIGKQQFIQCFREKNKTEKKESCSFSQRILKTINNWSKKRHGGVWQRSWSILINVFWWIVT